MLKTIQGIFQNRVNKTTGTLRDIASFAGYVQETFRALTRLNRSHLRPFTDVVIKQILFTGNHALFIIGFTAIVIGGLTIIGALPLLTGVGQKGLIPTILILVVVREVGPLITAIVIIIRSGSAITAEIATQKMNKELDALDLHGIDSYQYIVLPRVMGGMVATVCLLIYFDIFAIGGGYVIATLLAVDISAAEFFTDFMKALTINDLTSSILKGITYGLFIPLVCTYHGFLPSKYHEVPIFVSVAVVRSLITIFLTGGIISTIFYL